MSSLHKILWKLFGYPEIITSLNRSLASSPQMAMNLQGWLFYQSCSRISFSRLFTTSFSKRELSWLRFKHLNIIAISSIDNVDFVITFLFWASDIIYNICIRSMFLRWSGLTLNDILTLRISDWARLRPGLDFPVDIDVIRFSLLSRVDRELLLLLMQSSILNTTHIWGSQGWSFEL